MSGSNIFLKKRINIRCVLFIFLFSFILLCIPKSFSQKKLWEDSFNGGVTTGGYSPDYQSGGSGKFEVKVEKGSIIRKAFLLVGRFGVAQPITITMNGKQYLLDKNNMGTPQFQSRSYGGPSAVHVFDVTKDINPETTEYTIDVPQQPGPSNRFNDFYLFIAYQNKDMKKINAAVFLRNTDIVTSDKFKIELANPTKKNVDIGISLFCGYVCHMEGDGEFISLNGEKLGQIGGHDNNGAYCGGPIGSFYYKDNTLVGLQDDNADKSVNGSEALINAKTILKDKCTSFEMGFDADNKVYGNHETNAIWGVIIAYGSDECSLEIDAGPDMVVPIDSSAVINVEGPDGKYKWFPENGLSCIECKNPTVSPDSATMYFVTCIDSSGCSDIDTIVVYTNKVLAYYVTNPITPNGDGKNDVFMISLRRGKLLDFTISDKESKIIFKSTGETYEWNGNYYDGTPAPSGTYIYTLDYTDEEGNPVQKSGVFKLIR